MNDTAKQTGGCQCGHIRYVLTESPKQLIACHCTDCQRQSGSAFGLSLQVPTAGFQLTAGALKTISLKAPSGRKKLCAFCPECGSRIYNQPEKPGVIALKPGTLDNTQDLQPERHLWVSSKQRWVDIPDGAEVNDTQPG
ncbi:MAG: GFA family protein [Alphaproteobacteria bacterium]